jgi:hypothetical protein
MHLAALLATDLDGPEMDENETGVSKSGRLLRTLVQVAFSRSGVTSDI